MQDLSRLAPDRSELADLDLQTSALGWNPRIHPCISPLQREEYPLQRKKVQAWTRPQNRGDVSRGTLRAVPNKNARKDSRQRGHRPTGRLGLVLWPSQPAKNKKKFAQSSTRQIGVKAGYTPSPGSPSFAEGGTAGGEVCSGVKSKERKSIGEAYELRATASVRGHVGAHLCGAVPCTRCRLFKALGTHPPNRKCPAPCRAWDVDAAGTTPRPDLPWGYPGGPPVGGTLRG